MLDIVLFALTSSPANLPMSPLINEVKSVAMSNVDGVTPNHLLQQMYGTQVLDEDVDLELSDEELELIARRGGNVNSAHSDVFYRGRKIIDFRRDVKGYVKRNDHQGLIDHIKYKLDQAQIDYDFRVPGVLSDNLRAVAPIVIKGQRGGFKINLDTAQVCYNDTQCHF